MSTLQEIAAPSRGRRRVTALVSLAIVAAASLWTVLERRASTTRFRAGLVFTDDACALSPGVARTLGGPLSAADCAEVERIARAEVTIAFEGLRLDLTTDPRAFWTVHVQAFIPSRTRTLGAAGASLAFGPLGGRGTVGVMPLVAHAMRHAPSGSSRPDLVTAIGLGVGRSAVHEFAHQIAGGAIDGTDPDTYEYGSVDRPSQYYGALHWGATGERIRARLAR